MAKNVSVTLDWKGPFETVSSISGNAGIYMVIEGRKNDQGKWLTNTYELLDIGQTGDVEDRFSPHGREECWEQKKSSESTILFKFAAMPSKFYDKEDRRIVECCLRAHHRPLPCGTECNKGYSREDTVSIVNTGSYKPLKEKYFCGNKK